MLTRKRKTKSPCPICRLHLSRCICASIPKLTLQTRITLIIHAKELKRTTNTGLLATHALTNSETIIRGQSQERLDLSRLLTPEYESYVLYPSDDAVDIQTLRPLKPVQLLVADGNWRQAGKVNVRHPELAHLPRVKIGQQRLSCHHLRREHFAEGLSTLEAIALALETLEGPDKAKPLAELYVAKLHATLQGRGIVYK